MNNTNISSTVLSKGIGINYVVFFSYTYIKNIQ